MKKIKENSGVIFFCVVILTATIILMNDVKKDNMREDNKYVMTYLSK